MAEAEWRTRVTWLILHPDGAELLVSGLPGDGRLPETELAGDDLWMGDADVTSTALREQTGIDAVMLYCADRREDSAARLQELAIVATPRPGTELPANTHWAAAEDVAGPAAATARRVVAEVVGGRLARTRPPWSRPGWFPEAESWLRAAIEPQGYLVTEPLRQVRVWDLSCVLRAPTSRGDVYLKAAAESPLFANEATVVAALAELFPARVPAPLAVDGERRWLALPDVGNAVGGHENGWTAPIQVREAVLAAAAGMQREAAGHVEELRAAGCVNRDLAWLAAQAADWLPAIGATARQPGIDPASWLSAGEVAGLENAAPRIAAACDELAGYAVPHTLVHGDLLLSNTAVGPGGYLFFDWTDACVAHPFVDMLDIHNEKDEAVRDRLRAAYLREWSEFESAERLGDAWRLAEPLAALHHAISYRSIVTAMHPPIDGHMTESTAYWLRKVLAGLRQPDRAPLGSGS